MRLFTITIMLIIVLFLQSKSFSFFKFYFKYYSPSTGLPSLSVYSTIQDKEGYIWFATSSGLARYDGDEYKIFLIKDGLLSNIVTSLLLDYETLWIGTVKGLCKMNLKTMKIESIPKTNTIKSIFLDSKKRLWIIQKSQNVNERLLVFTKNKIQKFLFNKFKIPVIEVNVVFESYNGLFWLGTNDGAYQIDFNSGKTIKHYNKLGEFSLKSVNSFVESDKGIYLGASDGMFFLDNKNNKLSKYSFSKSFSSNVITHMIIEKNSRIWLATQKGVKLFNLFDSIFESYTVENGLPHNNISHLFQDREKNLWISTDGGGVAKLYDNKIAHYNISFQGNTKGIYSIIQAKNDKLWFGGEGIIASLYNQKEWTVSSQQTIVSGRYIKDIFFDANNELWFIANDISHLVSEKKILPYSKDFFLNGSNILSYCVVNLSDGEHEIFIGTEKGLYIILEKDYIKPVIFYQDKNIINNQIISIIVDKISYNKSSSSKLDLNIQKKNKKVFQNIVDFDNLKIKNDKLLKRAQMKADLWIATKNNGIYKLDKNHRLSAYKNNKKLINANIRKIFQDSKGDFWILSTQGVYVIKRSDNSLIRYSIENGLSENFIWDIAEDKKTNIWLATNGGGISIINSKGQITYHNISTGLSSNFVYKILIPKYLNNKSHFWIVTSKSLDFYNGKRFIHYSANSGLNGDLLGEFTPLFIDKKYNLWVGTNKGVTQIKYNFKKDDKNLNNNNDDYKIVSPKIILKKILLHNKNYNIFKDDNLSYNQNYLSFHFVALSYKDEAGVRYQYYLEGFDKDWGILTKKSIVRYDNLPSGNFRLKARSQNQYGIWSDKIYTINFSISPPFWKHPIFILGLIIIVSGGVFFLHKWNIKRLEKENILLEGKVKKRTEEIFQEKEKSEKLLLNILPVDVANELKENGFVIPRNYKNVTIMFSDFKDFTKIAEKLSADLLVKDLEKYFTFFDEVIKKWKIEKLKTIGDAYMCAGGLPAVNLTHPIDSIFAAIGFRDFVNSHTEKSKDDKKSIWKIRIGIHTGSVVAGVVGKSKFFYDIWGDAVNIASRMESSGEANKINISGDTYQLVKDFFDCENRGRISAKNKGSMDMYFVKSLKNKYRINSNLFEPNQLFWKNYKKLT